MPKVGNKKFPYTAKGKAQARREAALRARKMDESKRPRSQSSFNVKKEYAGQKADQTKFIDEESKRSRAKVGKALGKMAERGVADAKVARRLVDFKKSKRPKKQLSKEGLKETRYLADAKAAREGLLDLTGTKAPPLPKNWRTLDKDSGIRQLFREWYKQNSGKKAKSKKPKVNIKSHIARLERAVGVKPGQLR